MQTFIAQAYEHFENSLKNKLALVKLKKKKKKTVAANELLFCECNSFRNKRSSLQNKFAKQALAVNNLNTA